MTILSPHTWKPASSILIALSSVAFAVPLHAGETLPAGAPAQLECRSEDALSALRSLPASTSGLLHHARCALKNGHRTVALLALQRILAQTPDHPEALKLYGELSGSTAAQATPATPSILHREWLALEIGQDSNINSGAATTEIQTPHLNYPKLSLNKLLVAQPSGFAGLSGAAILFYPWSDSSQLYAGLHASARYNASRYVHFPHNYNLSAGFNTQSGILRYTAEVSATQNWLAGYKLLNAQTLKMQARLNASENLLLGIFATAGNNHYPQYGNATTAEKSIGLSAQHQPSRIELTVFGGRESTAGGAKELARNYDGFIVAYNLPLRQHHGIDLSYSRSNHRHPEYSPLFRAYRNDLLEEFIAQYRYRMDKDWTITPRMTLQNNASTIPLTRYWRNVWLVESRWDF